MAGTTANCWNKKHLLDYFYPRPWPRFHNLIISPLGVKFKKKKLHGWSPPHFYAWQESVLTDLWCIVSSVTNSLIMLLVFSFFSNTDTLTIISRAMSGHIFIWISSFCHPWVWCSFVAGVVMTRAHSSSSSSSCHESIIPIPWPISHSSSSSSSSTAEAALMAALLAGGGAGGGAGVIQVPAPGIGR